MPENSTWPPHPGRTPAQRRALDAIGCGEPPRCSPKTLRAMLDAGLIVDTGGEVRRDALGSYRIPSYAMPLLVHYQWCSAVAFTDEEMAEFEAELERMPRGSRTPRTTTAGLSPSRRLDR